MEIHEDEKRRIVFAVGKFADIILVTMDYRDHLLGKLADAFSQGAFVYTPEHKMRPDESLDFVAGPEGLAVVIENNEDVTDDFVKEAMALHETKHHQKGNGKNHGR